MGRLVELHGLASVVRQPRPPPAGIPSSATSRCEGFIAAPRSSPPTPSHRVQAGRPLNGAQGKVLRYDAPSARYVVRLEAPPRRLLVVPAGLLQKEKRIRPAAAKRKSGAVVHHTCIGLLAHVPSASARRRPAAEAQLPLLSRLRRLRGSVVSSLCRVCAAQT